MNRLYSFASLGGIECGAFRLRGVGLANCLFPWARCGITSERYGLVRIASTWPQVCHRQWLRWDRDKRCYLRLFDERNVAIYGRRKLTLLATKRHIDEATFLVDPERHDNAVVVFSGIQGYFSAIMTEHDRVRELLINSIRPQHRFGLDKPHRPRVFLHVRYGDFASPEDDKAAAGNSQHHVRQPIGWFSHILGELRRVVGTCVPAVVFSDAADDELRPLLALPKVTRCSFGSSVADLLALSAADFLVASGSTFSMWAGYLGRMPTIWPTGQRRQELHGGQWEFESEVGMTNIPDEVIALARRRLLA